MAGEKLTKAQRALSEYAWQTLAYCARVGMARSNERFPGVWRGLIRDGLVEPTGMHGRYRLYRLTDAGRAALQQEGQNDE